MGDRVITITKDEAAALDITARRELGALWVEAFAPMAKMEEAVSRIATWDYSHIITVRNEADDLVGCCLAFEKLPDRYTDRSEYHLYWDFLYLSQIAVRKSWRRRGVCGKICDEAKRIAGASVLHPGHLRPVALNIDKDDDEDVEDDSDDSDDEYARFKISDVYKKHGFRMATSAEVEATTEFTSEVGGVVDAWREARMIWWPEGSRLTLRQRIRFENILLVHVTKNVALCDQVADLWTEAFRTPPGEREAWIEGLSAAPPGASLLVGFMIDEGDMVCAAILTRNNPPEGKPQAPTFWDSTTISQMAVVTPYRGLGICKIMCDEAVELAGNSLIHNGRGRPLVLHAPRGGLQGLFETCGFRAATPDDMERTSPYILGQEDGTVRMIRWPAGAPDGA